MGDYILIDGDKVIFDAPFTPAVVTPKPGNIAGTGAATLSSKKLCVVGDEKKVEVKDCEYFTPQYSIPGKGTLKIQELASNQQATKTQTDGKKVLLLGAKFTAEFKVTQQAKEPPKGTAPPAPDPLTTYSGTGSFQTDNKKFNGT